MSDLKLDARVGSTEWSKQWAEARAYIEANLETVSVEDKQKFNVWDQVGVVWDTLKRVASEDWCWIWNSRCKYITVRIDMRDGNCLIMDKDGKRINPSDLRYQHPHS